MSHAVTASRPHSRTTTAAGLAPSITPRNGHREPELEHGSQLPADEFALYADDVRTVATARCRHLWPSEIVGDAACEHCGLEYADWSL
jgi:hypothetical protein